MLGVNQYYGLAVKPSVSDSEVSPDRGGAVTRQSQQKAAKPIKIKEPKNLVRTSGPKAKAPSPKVHLLRVKEPHEPKPISSGFKPPLGTKYKQSTTIAVTTAK